jgi:hypothetical protein
MLGFLSNLITEKKDMVKDYFDLLLEITKIFIFDIALALKAV